MKGKVRSKEQRPGEATTSRKRQWATWLLHTQVVKRMLRNRARSDLPPTIPRLSSQRFGKTPKTTCGAVCWSRRGWGQLASRVLYRAVRNIRGGEARLAIG